MGSIAEEAEPSASDDAGLESRIELVLGPLGSGRLLNDLLGIEGGHFVAEAQKTFQGLFSGRHAPAGMLHQAEGGFCQMGIPVLGQFLGRSLQGPAEPTLAPLAGIRGGSQACPKPLPHPRHGLLGPVAGIILGEGLLRLLVECGQQPGQDLPGRTLEMVPGGLLDVHHQGLRGAGRGRPGSEHRRPRFPWPPWDRLRPATLPAGVCRSRVRPGAASSRAGTRRRRSRNCGKAWPGPPAAACRLRSSRRPRGVVSSWNR